MREQHKVVAGVDMGATHIRFCLQPAEGSVLHREKRRTTEATVGGVAAGLAALVLSQR